MGKILVLAEKPSVGKEIARVLGCRKAGNGFLSGEKYIVTWALGHLVTLAEPEHYGEQYKSWRMDLLPMLPEKMALQVIPETAKQYGVVKGLLHSKEVSSLIIATDAGREGELVARWILAKAGWHKPCQRLWISSQTDKAIREGFAHLKESKAYDNLYQAAQGRAEADWLVGLNVTRALTCRYNAQLSAGRVQTPTLALLVRREQEIQEFQPQDYYQVRVDLGGFFVTYRDKNGQSAIYDKDMAHTLAETLRGADFCVTAVDIQEKKQQPPALYDLTELQREANRRYQYSPKETLNIMQRLYEQHKVLTYPRTDSRYLTEDIVPTLRERLKSVAYDDFAPLAGAILRENRTIAKACINNAKVSDHHAIIPTEEPADFLRFSIAEKRIYSLVVQRFLTCFCPDYIYRQVKIKLTALGEAFSASGREEIARGWKKVYDIAEEPEEVEQNLPALRPGMHFIGSSVQLKTLQTTAPPRYTEATLLSAMENPTKFIHDAKYKGYISGGLGTPATRADIIEKLFASFYIEKKGTALLPTSKGKQLIRLAPSELKEPLLTARWEEKLEAISQGQLHREDFIQEIKGYATNLVQQVAASQEVYVHDNLSRTPCPVCGKLMLQVQGKKGKMYVCQDRECGHRENISMTTQARCPNCHKKLELFGSGEKRIYVCSCGFREKATTFQARKKEQKGASKSEVRKYLNQQRGGEKEAEESPLAVALAAALAAKTTKENEPITGKNNK